MNSTGQPKRDIDGLRENSTGGLCPFEEWLESEARRLLRETKQSVVAVALDVGYTNPSHFAQVFRRETGPFPQRLPKATLSVALGSSHRGPWSS